MSRIYYTLLATLFISIFYTGCFKHTYTVGKGAPDAPVVYHHWHNHWLFGILGEENVDIEKLCPDGNATIQEETTFLNGVVDVLIGIIYSPTTVTVRCDDGSTAELELSGEQISRLVSDPTFLWMVRDLLPERYPEAVAAVMRHREISPDEAYARSPGAVGAVAPATTFSEESTRP